MTGSRRRITVILLCVFCFLCFSPLRVSAVPEVYRRVQTDSMKIAITFDDGPHPRHTPRILKILEDYGVKATFFMVGENVEYYPDAARAVIAAGHEVGNHTYSHCRVGKLGEEAILDELGKCEDALEELCEYRPHLFRPPEGALNTYVEHCSENGDYRLILWSLDTRDWEVKNADKIVQTVLDNVRAGDIILMHDYIGVGSETPEALERLLPELLSRGFEPVPVSELLGNQ